MMKIMKSLVTIQANLLKPLPIFILLSLEEHNKQVRTKGL